MKKLSGKVRGNFQKQLDEIASVINEEAKIIKVTDTALTVAQTNTLLNTKYPAAAVFSEVFAPNVATGTKYTKVSATGWVSSAFTALT